MSITMATIVLCFRFPAAGPYNLLVLLTIHVDISNWIYMYGRFSTHDLLICIVLLVSFVGF